MLLDFMKLQKHVSGMGRRSFLSVMAAAGSIPLVSTAEAGDSTPVSQQWAIFRSKYFRPDGRIVDTGNSGESHSEGQGYGMLFAASAGDQAAFEAIWVWARTNLQHKTDALFSWRYLDGHNPPVADKNNATDGDLLIALGLARAGKLWKRADYIQDAMAIYADVLKLMTMKVGPYEVLLPGATGFVTKEAVTLNLSYYVMPSLMQAFELTADARWQTVMENGLRIIAQGRFGEWKLPPDWLSINRQTGAFSIAKGWPPRFSYDAIRVPLYLYWAHMLSPDLLADFTRFWNHFGASALPGWVDLTNGSRSPYNAPPGYLAVASCSGLASAGELPTLDHAPDYYSAALTLLVYIARAEGGGM
ncbi:putative endoglucanase precursor [Komagataeibacter europaeus]|uniref:cellulase n=1 Tax=Komagataeibacter europaeus TaxID=33995 RepID=A0A0M0EGQ9_KOMEU|nr:glycosyl hydrolase family 8 [Komagataeibacter europaeus]ARW17920.1 Cellulase [Komagataeibacter europaeus]KON64136.1 putative endoglucanase precursor [Komagataeibacter europaeus]GBQ50640.1 endo-1,4-beta-glucanase [Komagataeibacter europaeus LMG 18890]